MKRNTILLSLGLLAGSATLHAQVIVYESFNYDSSVTSLNGVAATGTGVSGNWAQKHNGAGESNVVTGLSFGSLQTSGNAYQLLGDRLTAGQDRFNVANVVISASSSADTIWHSHLINFEVRDEDLVRNSTTPDARWQSLVGLHPAQMTRGVSPNVGFSATRDGAINQGALSLANLNTNGGNQLNFYETYLVVGKLTGMHNAGVGVTKTADMWVLSLSGFIAYLAAGATEGALDSNNVFKISSSVTNDTAIALSGHLNLYTLDWNVRNFNPIYDEIRFGTTLDSVTPIPEPSTVAALIGLLALGFVAWRRR